MLNFIKNSAYWTTFLVYYTCIILAVGTFVCAMVFVLIGHFAVDMTTEELFKKGAWIGFRYASIWAIGIATVKCFMRGKARKAMRA